MIFRMLTMGAVLGLLAACGGSDKKRSETFACPNGPNIAIAYQGDTAIVTLGDGRSEILQRTEPGKEIYAKPGMVWQIVAFRTGRLTDGQKSFHCDQSSV